MERSSHAAAIQTTLAGQGRLWMVRSSRAAAIQSTLASQRTQQGISLSCRTCLGITKRLDTLHRMDLPMMVLADPNPLSAASFPTFSDLCQL